MQPGLRVMELDSRNDSRWETFLAGHPDAQIYHHPAWLQALEAEYGQRCVVLGCESDAGQLLAVLPLTYTRGLPFNIRGYQTGRRLSSLPRTPVAGPLSIESRATVAIIKEAAERAAQQPGTRLEIKSELPDLDSLGLGLVCKPWRMTYVCELPSRVEDLRFGNARNHARIKWAVGKASKAGVKLRFAETLDDLRAWYQLHLETMRSHAVPPRSFRFFSALWESMRPRDLIRLLLAELHEGGRPRLLVGSLLLRFGQTVSYAFNGARERDFSFRPNDLIQWQAIHDACADGFRRYDLGEVSADNPTLAEFKNKWGAKPRQLYRYYYPVPRGVDPAPAAPRGLERLLADAWRRLPLAVTARLGDWVYSHL